MITTAPVRRLLLAALVVGLLAGLVGMHHLAGAGPASPVATASAAAPMTVDGDPHDDGHRDAGAALLHLCLAVLVAVAALVVGAALVLLSRPAPDGPGRVTASGRVRTAPRAPPSGAPARLALLCVLRT
jgi:hypothetical protein